MPPRQARVERVAQAVAEQVDRSTVSDRKTPGNSRIVPATWNRLRASAMMLPQLGMLGGVPAPMNDRIASVIIAEAQM